MSGLIEITAPAFIRALSSTLKVAFSGPLPPENEKRIYAFLHGRQFALFSHERPRPVVVMSSMSPDGRMQAGILRRLGFLTVDGSSSRGGAAGLKGIIKCIRNGNDAAFAVDGPKGPFGQAKPGVIQAARISGARVVPVTSAASSCRVFEKAWDRYMLPMPFSSVLVLRGESFYVKDSDDINDKCRLLSGMLRDLTQEADELVRGQE